MRVTSAYCINLNCLNKVLNLKPLKQYSILFVRSNLLEIPLPLQNLKFILRF